MTEGTEITGGTEERRRTTERGARQQAGAAGPAHDGKNSGNTNAGPAARLRFRCSFRRVTRFAGLSRAAVPDLRSRSVSPFLCVNSVASVSSVTVP